MTIQSLKDRLLSLSVAGNLGRLLEAMEIHKTLIGLEDSDDHIGDCDEFVRGHIKMSCEGHTRTEEEIQTMTKILQDVHGGHKGGLAAELQKLSQRIDQIQKDTP